MWWSITFCVRDLSLRYIWSTFELKTGTPCDCLVGSKDSLILAGEWHLWLVVRNLWFMKESGIWIIVNSLGARMSILRSAPRPPVLVSPSSFHEINSSWTLNVFVWALLNCRADCVAAGGETWWLSVWKTRKMRVKWQTITTDSGNLSRNLIANLCVYVLMFRTSFRHLGFPCDGAEPFLILDGHFDVIFFPCFLNFNWCRGWCKGDAEFLRSLSFP